MSDEKRSFPNNEEETGSVGIQKLNPHLITQVLSFLEAKDQAVVPQLNTELSRSYDRLNNLSQSRNTLIKVYMLALDSSLMQGDQDLQRQINHIYEYSTHEFFSAFKNLIDIHPGQDDDARFKFFQDLNSLIKISYKENPLLQFLSPLQELINSPFHSHAFFEELKELVEIHRNTLPPEFLNLVDTQNPPSFQELRSLINKHKSALPEESSHNLDKIDLERIKFLRKIFSDFENLLSKPFLCFNSFRAIGAVIETGRQSMGPLLIYENLLRSMTEASPEIFDELALFVVRHRAILPVEIGSMLDKLLRQRNSIVSALEDKPEPVLFVIVKTRIAAQIKILKILEGLLNQIQNQSPEIFGILYLFIQDYKRLLPVQFYSDVSNLLDNPAPCLKFSEELTVLMDSHKDSLPPEVLKAFLNLIEFPSVKFLEAITGPMLHRELNILRRRHKDDFQVQLFRELKALINTHRNTSLVEFVGAIGELIYSYRNIQNYGFLSQESVLIGNIHAKLLNKTFAHYPILFQEINEYLVQKTHNDEIIEAAKQYPALAHQLIFNPEDHSLLPAAELKEEPVGSRMKGMWKGIKAAFTKEGNGKNIFREIWELPPPEIVSKAVLLAVWGMMYFTTRHVDGLGKQAGKEYDPLFDIVRLLPIVIAFGFLGVRECRKIYWSFSCARKEGAPVKSALQHGLLSRLYVLISMSHSVWLGYKKGEKVDQKKLEFNPYEKFSLKKKKRAFGWGFRALQAHVSTVAEIAQDYSYSEDSKAMPVSESIYLNIELPLSPRHRFRDRRSLFLCVVVTSVVGVPLLAYFWHVLKADLLVPAAPENILDDLHDPVLLSNANVFFEEALIYDSSRGLNNFSNTEGRALMGNFEALLQQHSAHPSLMTTFALLEGVSAIKSGLEELNTTLFARNEIVENGLIRTIADFIILTDHLNKNIDDAVKLWLPTKIIIKNLNISEDEQFKLRSDMAEMYVEAMQYSPLIKKLMSYYALISLGTLTLDRTFKTISDSSNLGLSEAFSFKNDSVLLYPHWLAPIPELIILPYTVQAAIFHLFHLPENVTSKKEIVQYWEKHSRDCLNNLFNNFSYTEKCHKTLEKELNELESQNNIDVMRAYKHVITTYLGRNQDAELIKKAQSLKKGEELDVTSMDWRPIPGINQAKERVKVLGIVEVESTLPFRIAVEFITETDEEVKASFKIGAIYLQNKICRDFKGGVCKGVKMNEAIAMIYQTYSPQLIEILFPKTQEIFNKLVNDAFYQGLITYKKVDAEPENREVKTTAPVILRTVLHSTPASFFPSSSGPSSKTSVEVKESIPSSAPSDSKTSLSEAENNQPVVSIHTSVS